MSDHTASVPGLTYTWRLYQRNRNGEGPDQTARPLSQGFMGRGYEPRCTNP